MKNKNAIVDPASYSLPYDIMLLLSNAEAVQDFYCSSTAYNENYILLLKRSPKIKVLKYSISKANKILGLINYIKMLVKIFFKRNEYKEINFQWSIFFPLEFFFFLIIRKKLKFTFHNDVPHGSTKKVVFKNLLIAKLSSRIEFVSETTFNNFISSYGSEFVQKSFVRKHPLMPLVDNSGHILKCERRNVRSYDDGRLIFWGNVKPYKGVHRLLELPNSMVSRFRPLVIGKWDKSLIDTKNKLIEHGIEIKDTFICSEELATYLSGNNVFILPYTKATQSGVLYTLKYYNCRVVCSDSGDNACYLRRVGEESRIFSLDGSNMVQVVESAFDDLS